MLKVIAVFWIFFLISGCDILPGMHNPNIYAMQQYRERNLVVTYKPKLIRITPTLIADQRISTYFYHVAASDVLGIDVWQHPEFNLLDFRIPAATTSTQGAAGQVGYLVNADGKIYFPLIGYVKVADKTIDEIRSILASRLKTYVKDPQVSVRVMDYRGQKVYVQGEVIKPGFLPINDQPLTIADALTLSGSMDPNAADTRHIYVIRGDFTHPTIYWLDAKTPDAWLLAERFSLQPKDILYVSSATATRWNRVLNQLLPTIQAVWYTRALINTNW